MDHPSNPVPAATVLVMGTGSVGGYLGGCLQAAGARVHLVVRPRMHEALRAHGLHLTDLDGRDQSLPADALHLHPQLPSALLPDLVLLTVKAGATETAARQLAAALPPGTPVLSLQNGIGQAERAAAVAPALQWLTGMVPFNIAELGPGHLHRGSGGHLAAQDAPVLRRLAPLFEAAGLPLALHADMRPVQWGKLLLNLNNPLNALSGLPLRAQLLDRGWRRLLADLQRETLAVLDAAGIAPAAVTPLPPARLPTLLSLPTPLFRLAAARMLRIDAHARSSMADDLALGRPTEIDALCGEVVRLGLAVGRPTPLCSGLVALLAGATAPPACGSAAALRQSLREALPPC